MFSCCGCHIACLVRALFLLTRCAAVCPGSLTSLEQELLTLGAQPQDAPQVRQRGAGHARMQTGLDRASTLRRLTRRVFSMFKRA